MRRSLLLTALALVACGDPPSAPPDGSVQTDGSVDASADAGSDASSGDGGPGDAGEPLPELPSPWRRERSFPVGVDHHASAIVETPAGAYLYVIGGLRVEGTSQPVELYSAVRRARIGHDGVLGAWEDETPLGGPLAFHSIATSGRMIILAGGASVSESGGLGWFGSVMWNVLDDEGHLGAWGGAPTFDSPALHATATVLGDRVYFVGGGAGAASSDPRVLSMRIGADALDDLRVEASLPAGRSHHVTMAREGALYVAGGFAGPPTPATAVLRATIDGAGVPGAWEDAGVMTEPLWTAALVEVPGAMILVGGGLGPAPTDRVVRYPLDAAGVGGAELLAPLPYPRAHVHQTPTHGGRLYSVGGRYAESFGQASSADVYSAAIADL